MATTILVANPSARSGRARERIDAARGALVAAGIEHDFVPTEPDGGTVDAVRRALAAGARRVIAMGGDGTFAAVAKGVLAADSTGVALGILPMGTANDQAKSFGIRTGDDDLADNVAIIAAGATYQMDVGRVERRDERDRVVAAELFFDSFSIGLGAAVLAARNRDRERAEGIPLVRYLYRDQLVYAGALVRSLARALVPSRSFTVEALVDGQVHRFADVVDVIVKNTPIYGGEWILAPEARADDGRFELIPVMGLADFGKRMVSALRSSPVDEHDLRALGLELAHPVPGTSFELTVHGSGAAPPPAQIDGEELAAGERYSVEVLPRRLHVIVPEAMARAQGPLVTADAP